MSTCCIVQDAELQTAAVRISELTLDNQDREETLARQRQLLQTVSCVQDRRAVLLLHRFVPFMKSNCCTVLLVRL